MADFFIISTRSKRGIIEIYPKFIISKSSDLMIRGGDFYAVWLEDRGVWSTDEQDVIDLIDKALDDYVKQHREKLDGAHKVLHMWDAETGMINNWHTYCKQQLRDTYTPLDQNLIFSNTEVNKKDYSSKRLSYPLEPGSTEAYNKLMSTLYSDEERHKIEWAIGAIVTGDSKKLQKFMVLYGAAGTGKSTVLNIVQQLFDGYDATFDAKSLGSGRDQFALEAFKSGPLVAIQHDGDLSKIEDNTVLNSLVSHEQMMVNEKFKGRYPARFLAFLFMGTNKPVKITDGKSGIIRRLIDVSPTGNKIPTKEYRTLMKQISFELGAIACHCRDVYLADKHAYDDYIPVTMFGASNDFYNFVIDSYHVFKKEDSTTLKAAWEMYKKYCEEAKVPYPFPLRNFKEELKNYFWEYNDRFNLEDGSRVRSYYSGFRTDQFESSRKKKKEKIKTQLIQFDSIESIFDVKRADCFAQYATTNETPGLKWDNVNTKLSDLDTSRLHYVKVPENHIVIDFDIKDESGNKSFEKNIEEASKWPKTYAELSKSGGGIHLHYIYSGDVTALSRVYDDDIEIKVFTGKQSLRRKLTKCNNLPIATINSGLPLKGDKMINKEVIKTEKGIRTLIKRNLNKEYHPGTKPSVDFIFTILEDAYKDGLKYDVSDMKNAVLAFAANSTNQAQYCMKLVNNMHFKSDDVSIPVDDNNAQIVFYDVEVFPNLLLINWKFAGEKHKVVRMINPSPTDVEGLIRHRLVGFNCRRYDNHILYARLMGYDNDQLYRLSQKLISKDSKGAFFGEAYNISYTDVYDFAATKQSLKKWEIELGIHHQELGLPWDKPVPENMWVKVAEYCDNDVIATEAVFNHLKGDWTARQILANLSGLSVNDTTNSHTTRIIFGTNRTPQDQFNYRNMGEVTKDTDRFVITKDNVVFNEFGDEYTMFNGEGKPVFPGYKYENGVSTYRGEEVGEGGYVYAEPGMYGNIALLDVASMHPSSIVAENLFGTEYTERFKDILDARVAIKHKDFTKARNMLNGKLAPYLNNEETAAELAQALKIAINSVYGLTSANFDNPFRDIRNKDNIVAKRGALFMINLKHEVQNRGFTVAHIKTDSIKIPDATPEIIEFVMDYGKQYGYTFEHEATYDRMCLVNDAVYIAKYKDGDWTATGTQFAVPYVFKKLFSKEPIEFDDMCETKSVTTALYLDMNENKPNVYILKKEREELSEKYNHFGEYEAYCYKGPELEAYEQAKKRFDEINKLLDSEEYHNYRFIGKVGRFCPIKPGCNGGELLREGKDKEGNIKYSAATGSKGYRWLESELVKDLHKEDDIDISFYNKLVDDAADTINKHGDFDWFVSGDPYDAPPFTGGKIISKKDKKEK